MTVEMLMEQLKKYDPKAVIVLNNNSRYEDATYFGTLIAGDNKEVLIGTDYRCRYRQKPTSVTVAHQGIIY